ncbi:hypothetical protein FHX37_3392 [Haloactinospora alba]|uniref:Uncharacterized protein n=1 Tax=Haloactinospora alba TaxID=405555 RepID=A0A543NNK6_9ACTN|nr:hypothetical protein [Haloactinospora alba]TQN33377.1 hypothetical protein FHX37_3392 [Haloactinospora alba]
MQQDKRPSNRTCVSLRLSGVPEGVQCQARPVEVDSNGATVETDQPVEFPGTSGDTFVKVPATGYVNANRRLRVEVTHHGADGTVPSVITGKARFQVWER